MSPGVAHHVFEAFYTTKGMEGTRLGLWVSKEIIDRDQGTLHLRTSQCAGRSGTVFSVVYRAALKRSPQRVDRRFVLTAFGR